MPLLGETWDVDGVVDGAELCWANHAGLPKGAAMAAAGSNTQGADTPIASRMQRRRCPTGESLSKGIAGERGEVREWERVIRRTQCILAAWPDMELISVHFAHKTMTDT